MPREKKKTTIERKRGDDRKEVRCREKGRKTTIERKTSIEKKERR